MIRPRALVAVVGLAVAALSALALPRGQRGAVAEAAPPARAARATVVYVATHVGASVSSLYLAPVGASSPGAPVATFSHLEGATVRATLLPGSLAVVAIAETQPARDVSFASSLFLVRPHAPPEQLCDHVAFASRPLVADDGRVFVSRGVAGSQPTPRSYREDDLTVDEVDLATGATRTLLADHGYLLFLAGAFEREVIVYRVGPGRADLVAVDADSLATRPLGSVPPFARDFSIDDQGGLVFQDRDQSDVHQVVVDRIDLGTGARTRLFSGASANLAPHAVPGGGVLLNPVEGGGFDVVGASPRVRAPLGAGVDGVQARSADRAWLAALHFAPSALPVPFAIETSSGLAHAIPAPPGTRIAVAGIVAGAP